MTGRRIPEDEATQLPTLALVTCGPQLEAALSSPGLAACSSIRLGGITPRSTLVLAAVDLLVEDAAIARTDIERIVVSRGPGSFTGIRAGLATALGLAAATNAECIAFDSLLMLAARCGRHGEVWAAQPGRRNEVYARRFALSESGPPEALMDIEIMPVEGLGDHGPWVAAEALDLGGVKRANVGRSSAEALLELARRRVPSQPVDPLYVEGPPIHGEVSGT